MYILIHWFDQIDVAFILVDQRYLVITGNVNPTNHSSHFQLGPFIKSKSSNDTNHCLQFRYFIHGQGFGRLVVIQNRTDNKQNNESLILNWKDQGKFGIIMTVTNLCRSSRPKLEANSKNNIRH